MKNKFLIRKTEMNDLPVVMNIYSQARKYMAENGNPNQWGPTCWPPEALIINDIHEGKSYVCIDDHNAIAAVFYFNYGIDIEPTYQVIDGKWTGNNEYGVIHRIAVSTHQNGAGSYCINWAYDQCHHLRMDTHADNIPMQHLLKKLGFLYCGIIYVHEDNDPRLAYEKTEGVNNE